jgi:hypothetical protein
MGGMTRKIPVKEVNGQVEDNPAPDVVAPRREGRSKRVNMKRIIWSAAAAVVILFALGGGLWAAMYPGSGSTVEIPDVTGKLYDEVKDLYIDRGIKSEHCVEVIRTVHTAS